MQLCIREQDEVILWLMPPAQKTRSRATVPAQSALPARILHDSASYHRSIFCTRKHRSHRPHRTRAARERPKSPKSTWIRQHVEIQVDSAGTPESTLSDNARYLTTWIYGVPLNPPGFLGYLRVHLDFPVLFAHGCGAATTAAAAATLRASWRLSAMNSESVSGTGTSYLLRMSASAMFSI